MWHMGPYHYPASPITRVPHPVPLVYTAAPVPHSSVSAVIRGSSGSFWLQRIGQTRRSFSKTPNISKIIVFLSILDLFVTRVVVYQQNTDLLIKLEIVVKMWL